MNRILIDLTDIELWSGHHGGTQRVVYGIAKNFFLESEKLDQEVIFMAFSPRSKTFHRTSFAPIYDRVESIKSAPAVGAGVVGVPLKVRLKHRLRPYVPESVRRSDSARRLALKSYKVASRALRLAQAAARARKNNIQIEIAPDVTFTKNDTVLILGKPWDNLDIQRTLTLEKNKSGFKLVQVVYDLIICLNPQLHHPSLFKQYTQHMFEAISASDLMLPISKNTDRDLKKLCGMLNLPIPATKVIRLGDEVADVTTPTIKPDARISDQFIACIGTIEIRKNHMLLYYAYKLALEREIELPQLVIVGSRGWLSGDFQYLVDNDPATKNKILVLDNVSDQGLTWIYQNCNFTVYPSMYEGWGLPIAVSLAYGKLCISSQTSSMTEIAGELLDYFSPFNTAECLEKIVTYTDAAKLEIKEREIQKTYTATSWKQTFMQTYQAIKGD